MYFPRKSLYVGEKFNSLNTVSFILSITATVFDKKNTKLKPRLDYMFLDVALKNFFLLIHIFHHTPVSPINLFFIFFISVCVIQLLLHYIIKEFVFIATLQCCMKCFPPANENGVQFCVCFSRDRHQVAN